MSRNKRQRYLELQEPTYVAFRYSCRCLFLVNHKYCIGIFPHCLLQKHCQWKLFECNFCLLKSMFDLPDAILTSIADFLPMFPYKPKPCQCTKTCLEWSMNEDNNLVSLDKKSSVLKPIYQGCYQLTHLRYLLDGSWNTIASQNQTPVLFDITRIECPRSN
jgi:hypothetical protein